VVGRQERVVDEASQGLDRQAADCFLGRHRALKLAARFGRFKGKIGEMLSESPCPFGSGSWRIL